MLAHSVTLPTFLPLLPSSQHLFASSQVTGELFSSQGISLGRWTATWLPRPQPLIFRLLNELILGPWRALGLMSSSVRIDLPIFDSYTNPQAPPGGWGALPGYRRFYLRQQLVMQSMDEFGEEGEWSQATRRQGSAQQQEEEKEDDVGHVPGPRALWLRLMLSGRSYESGPPRVYKARAKFDVDRGKQWCWRVWIAGKSKAMGSMQGVTLI